MELEQILRGVLPPLVVALILLAPRLRRGGDAEGASLGAAGALGLGLGAALGGVFLLGGFGQITDPISAQHKLVWVAAAAGLIAMIDRVLGSKSSARVAARTILRFLGPAIVLWWFLAFRRRSAWDTGEAWMWTSVFAVAIAALGTALDGMAARRPGASLPCAWVAAMSVAGGAMVAGRSASYGQLAGTLAAALGACVLVALVNPGLVARGAGMTIALFLGALVLAGHYTAELARSTAIAVFVAPLAPALVELVPLRERAALAGTLRVVLAAAPGLVWIWLTYEAPPPSYY